ENGTGKELVARTLHQFSSRPEEPFIIVNCAAILAKNIDSELFGHEKGSLAHAPAKNKGKFELASGGTLFLDEIGDMNLETQAKILRALESKTFQRVGGGRTLQVDVKIIAATNKDLEREIQAKRFRQDLFYRLNGIPVHVPPLRKRKEDIPVLVEIFLAAFAKQAKAPRKTITREAVALLMAYSWPGNVRELKNLVERLSIMVTAETIESVDIPAPYNGSASENDTTGMNNLLHLDSLEQAKKMFEKTFLKQKLAEENGDLASAAQKTGIDPDTMAAITGGKP
ncbi:MAG: sigma-54 dependent transcriptional regulator, partial [Desulfobacteraceae bacterium]